MNALAAREMSVFLNSWLAYRARHVSVPGFAVAILAGDDLVFHGAYGLADLEGQVPLTTGHLFAISSQSKMFTATALLQLVEQDRVALDHAAARYLPWLAGHRDPRFAGITIRQLLTHSAGIGREGDDADHWQLLKPFPTRGELRALVLGMPMAVDTNVRVKYSNIGYAVLGAVVEAVTGTPFADHVTARIIEPLGLRSTVADYPPSMADRIATGYSLPFAHERIPLIGTMSSNAYAAVMGVYATADDMCRFAQAHFWGDSRLIGDALKKEAQRTQWMVMEGRDRGYECGLGFEVTRVCNRRLVGHTGAFSGYVTGTFFEPEERLALSVMVNCRDVPILEMLRGLVEVVDHFQTHATTTTPVERARLSTRVCSPLAAVEIHATAGSIVAMDPDTWRPFEQSEELAVVAPNTLRVVTPNSYFYEGELVQHEFVGESVKSVRFAGMTLRPERDYRRYAASPQNGRDQQSDTGIAGNTDPGHGTLCTGTVVAVERCGPSWPWRHRLMIQYDDGIGLRRCLTTLTKGVAANVIGRRVLGIVHPVRWCNGPREPAGSRTDEVMALGLARDPDGQASLLPGMLIPLSATANGGTLPVELTNELFARHLERGRDHWFKFEPRSDYPDSRRRSPSLAAWIRGDRDGARVLMYEEARRGAFGYTERGPVRVRVIEEGPVTPFMQWERELFERIFVPIYGDTIYTVPRAALAGVEVPSGDMVIFDHRCAIINGYDEHGALQYRTVVDAGQGDRADHLGRLEAVLMERATRYGHRIAPAVEANLPV